VAFYGGLGVVLATPVEIINYYLGLKITGNDGEVGFIPVVDFFKQDP
jgi:hypothetical protein